MKIDHKIKQSFLGIALTGTVGGLIGFFLGNPIYIIVMALVGALLGYTIWTMGGQRFFLFIIIGAILGGGLATYLNGTEVSLIGAATGGAMGGFLGVNFLLFQRGTPPAKGHS